MVYLYLTFAMNRGGCWWRGPFVIAIAFFTFYIEANCTWPLPWIEEVSDGQQGPEERLECFLECVRTSGLPSSTLERTLCTRIRKNKYKGVLRPKTHLKPIYLYLPYLQYYSSKSKNISTNFWSKQFCIGWIDDKSFRGWCEIVLSIRILCFLFEWAIPT